MIVYCTWILLLDLSVLAVEHCNYSMMQSYSYNNLRLGFDWFVLLCLSTCAYVPRTVSLTEPFRCSSWPERKLKEMKIPREKRRVVNRRIKVAKEAGAECQSLIVSGRSSILARATFVSASARGTSMSFTVLIVHSSHLGKIGWRRHRIYPGRKG